MKNKLFLLLLFIVGVINFLPVFGLFSANQMAQVYAVDLANNELQMLMRHRALLFGIIGGFVLCALFKPKYQPVAMIMAGISMVGFLVLVWMVGDTNEAILNVTRVDVVGILCLVLAALIKYGFNKK